MRKNERSVEDVFLGSPFRRQSAYLYSHLAISMQSES